MFLVVLLSLSCPVVTSVCSSSSSIVVRIYIFPIAIYDIDIINGVTLSLTLTRRWGQCSEVAFTGLMFNLVNWGLLVHTVAYIPLHRSLLELFFLHIRVNIGLRRLFPSSHGRILECPRLLLFGTKALSILWITNMGRLRLHKTTGFLDSGWFWAIVAVGLRSRNQLHVMCGQIANWLRSFFLLLLFDPLPALVSLSFLDLL